MAIGRAPARCLVFGGSGALGGAVCEALAAAGARVALTYHANRAAAEALAARLPGAIPLAVDVASVAEVDRVVDAASDALGGIDAFVHAAAIGVAVACEGAASSHRLPQIDEAAFDRLIAVNLRSAFFAVRRVAPIMAADGGGSVVLVGSVDGVKAIPSPAHYAASKAGLGGFVRAASKELGEARVLLNVVAPGVLEAGLSRLIPENLHREYEKHCGLRRRGRLAEIAATCAWLALENTYVTGQTILIDGAL